MVVLLLWIICVFCVLCFSGFCVRSLERADLLALVGDVYCIFVISHVVSWVRCSTWLNRFLIFVVFLTLWELSMIWLTWLQFDFKSIFGFEGFISKVLWFIFVIFAVFYCCVYSAPNSVIVSYKYFSLFRHSIWIWLDGASAL